MANELTIDQYHLKSQALFKKLDVPARPLRSQMAYRINRLYLPLLIGAMAVLPLSLILGSFMISTPVGMVMISLVFTPTFVFTLDLLMCPKFSITRIDELALPLWKRMVAYWFNTSRICHSSQEHAHVYCDRFLDQKPIREAIFQWMRKDGYLGENELFLLKKVSSEHHRLTIMLNLNSKLTCEQQQQAIAEYIDKGEGNHKTEFYNRLNSLVERKALQDTTLATPLPLIRGRL